LPRPQVAVLVPVGQDAELAQLVDVDAGAHGTLTIMREISGAIEAGEPSPPRRRGHGPSVVGVSLLTAGWLIVAVLGLVALLRLVAWDSVEPLIVLNALTFFVYLPAWVVTAGTLITRR
jgi:hypothetical protein